MRWTKNMIDLVNVFNTSSYKCSTQWGYLYFEILETLGLYVVWENPGEEPWIVFSEIKQNNEWLCCKGVPIILNAPLDEGRVVLSPENVYLFSVHKKIHNSEFSRLPEKLPIVLLKNEVYQTRYYQVSRYSTEKGITQWENDVCNILKGKGQLLDRGYLYPSITGKNLGRFLKWELLGQKITVFPNIKGKINEHGWLCFIHFPEIVNERQSHLGLRLRSNITTMDAIATEVNYLLLSVRNAFLLMDDLYDVPYLEPIADREENNHLILSDDILPDDFLSESKIRCFFYTS